MGRPVKTVAASLAANLEDDSFMQGLTLEHIWCSCGHHPEGALSTNPLRVGVLKASLY
jgi:hypothetical protein